LLIGKIIAIALGALCWLGAGGVLRAAEPASYRNPILHADYSDPDVIRVGDRYYMVASTFHFSPGLPLLESRDLVHWRLIGHALKRLDFHPSYDLPGPLEFDDATERVRFDFRAQINHRYSAGVWAPAIRHHGGRFYIYFATPNEGVFMVSAARAEGPWDPPVKLIDQPGLEDPCPFWDDDGNAYLVHSKVGAGPLILRRMSADGTKVLDEGKVIVEDAVRLPILEGPKLHKRNGYYYIFAPYGGVGEGPQAVLRSREIYGPYEFRTVLSKGTTNVQAPHQGGYVETPRGQGWFIHFNSTGAYGRIVHLQPVTWRDDWPAMGDGGHPVASHPVPDVGRRYPPVFPQVEDEFDTATLGVQWEWNHNPQDTHWSLTARAGFLRLEAMRAPNLLSARNTLTQVLQSRASEITTRLSIGAMQDGQRAGLAMFGRTPSWIGVVQQEGKRHITLAAAGIETTDAVVPDDAVLLRMRVVEELVEYAYSLDEGKTFTALGPRARMFFSFWKGARPALFTFNRTSEGGIVDFDFVHARTPERIDRQSLVTRHNPALTRIDPHSALMVGNGELAFTADITGLQTFQEQYSPLVPLITQSQWAWHSFPNPQQFRYEDTLVPVDVRGQQRLYPWLHDWDEAKKPPIAWMRENPHRFSLGRVGLHLLSSRGSPARFEDLTQAHQSLDMWHGTLLSSFVFEGQEVKVETRVHPYTDTLIVTLKSPLLATGRLGVTMRFPGVAAQLNPDPADWSNPQQHQTSILTSGGRELALERRLDDTRYFVTAGTDRNVSFDAFEPHAFRVIPRGKTDEMTLLVRFSRDRSPAAMPEATSARADVHTHWQRYWSTGGAIDFSGSTDPRAHELERRVVLSQYLMALNAAGSLPPQEEGLFSNSWNGKFHLEMHPWHAAHFALWGRAELLERSMPWYREELPRAKQRALAYGVQGAWWPKMAGPDGRESPSTINPFIMWQQPHPILLAELIYRARPGRDVLERYREIVYETADLLASFAHADESGTRYVIGPPIIPAQEVFPPLTTFNPTFELEYFRFGLQTAQTWRERLGVPRDVKWDRVLRGLAPLPQKDGLYLATESFPQQWEQARSPECSAGKTADTCWDRDHPSFLAALGFLPGRSVDRETMRRTLRAVEADWDLRQTWGWDFPMMAMTAARLKEPDKAIDFLLHDAENNRFGVAGMTPRMHLEGESHRRAAETYFPSNGGLLLAVALMAAGWDGERTLAPGFPKDGRWQVRSEGLLPLP
jgi:beta-xylosidase